MVLGGLARLAGGLRGTRDERVASIVGGLASVVLGVLALAWPDVTILVVAVLVGPLAIILGVRQIVRALRHAPSGAPAPRGRLRRWAHVAGATLALLLAAALAGVSALLHGDSASLDDFYGAPARLPAKPGTAVTQR